ncbi:MAG: tRNA (adenosine(37)-N6)-threonylcarbamoyltransferase complex dimerization subunit type 1 TsaB [Xanthobacteraceae bacterium]|nr:tRNA (adenosine(37)-N6)-threonylcarbamoyltransferase complex dimerization subunit type 1 TsaB [Xanthobacteraceae bacterium]
MLVLAIDTALQSCAAAVLDTESERCLAKKSLLMQRGHAEALMPLIAEMMREAAVDYPQLERIAVTVGPGSFTGLRVGISAARGIGLAANKPVVGVTTLAAYAAPVIGAGGEEPVIVAIDARHDHVYSQTFSSDGTTLIRPAIASIDETFRAARFGALRFVGDAAQLLADRWPPQFEPPASIDPQPAPGIEWVAWIGATSDPAIATPRPYYLRAPDAKTKAELAQR